MSTLTTPGVMAFLLPLPLMLPASLRNTFLSRFAPQSVPAIRSLHPASGSFPASNPMGNSRPRFAGSGWCFGVGKRPHQHSGNGNV
jgi:hypothetical protein